jgi:acyl-CoA thioesterase-1
MARRLAFALLVLLFATAAQAAPIVLVVGDSLSAGYGVDAGRGWVALLTQRLQARNPPYQVINASISGDTTAGGLARLPAALQRHRPAIVLLELGGNDGLRGQSLEAMRANLEQMIALSRAAHALPVLFEMRLPQNYGPAYVDRFTRTFDDVAQAQKIPLVPFFLGAIAPERAQWFQEDGIHPTADAQPQLLDSVWPVLAPLLGKASASAASAAP